MTTLPVPRPTRTLLTKSLSILVGLAGLLASSSASAADHPGEDALADLGGKKAAPNTIQNKFFVKTNRFEIAPAAGYVPNNAFVTSAYGGAFIAYHFSDSFAAEAMGVGGIPLGEAGVKGLTQTLVQIAYEGNSETTFQQPLNRLVGGAIFSARWSPVYGKINLIGEGVLNFDVYGTAGVGVLIVANDYAKISDDYPSDDPRVKPAQVVAGDKPAHFGVNLGVGMNFFLTQSVALKIDARSTFYVADEPDYGNKNPDGSPVELEPRIYNTFLTTGGISIFVPRMKPRLFNF